jgi:hypothetical protein
MCGSGTENSIHVRALSQFLLHISVLPPSELTLSQANQSSEM